MNKKSGKGFDRIALIYDVMASVMSFNQINRSQCAFLSHLSTQSTALIIGGGSGYFLQKLLQTNKTVHVTYVDASKKMIELSRKRIADNIQDGLGRVTFICKPIEEFEFEKYDSIVCNYFLDLFDQTHVFFLIETFKKHLNSGGLLYITDFNIPPGKGIIQWSTRVGLKILYYFFRHTASVKANKLPDINSIVVMQNFKLIQSKTFLNGVLMCNLYKQSIIYVNI